MQNQLSSNTDNFQLTYRCYKIIKRGSVFECLTRLMGISTLWSKPLIVAHTMGYRIERGEPCNTQ